MDTDPSAPFHIVSPDESSLISAKNKFCKALKKMDLILPELANEFKTLIREVIFVKGDDSLKYGFAGGSSYMLWGALFLNVEEHYEDIDLIEAMSHESGHTLLFGFSLDEPLVLNDDADLYPSPLRDDLRPMDGIYHATYVCARICWTMTELLKTRQLLQKENESVKIRLNNNIENFCNGYEVIKKYGKLTLTGKKIMKQTHTYMSTIMNK
jgi:HEXXH motif-containing protein